jgi:hypothetical protein
MSDQSEHIDPIDRLFKKKAEEHEIPFREEDWNRMEQQLNSALPAGSSADTTFDGWPLPHSCWLRCSAISPMTITRGSRNWTGRSTQLPPLIPEQLGLHPSVNCR